MQQTFLTIPLTIEQLRQMWREDLRAELSSFAPQASTESNLPERPTRKQVADFLQISLVALNDWSKPNNDRPALLTPIKIGSRVRYDRDAVLALAMSRPKYRRR